MKFLLILFSLFYSIYIICAQFGSLNLNAKPNDQFQLTSSSLFSPKSTSNVLKKLYSLVDTHQFVIENTDSPQYPDNIKYTETDSNAIYFIELPHFPKFITKNDIKVETGVAGVRIIAKDSGLYHNDAFFPDLTEDTMNSIVRGRDYQINLRYFRKLKNNESKTLVEIKEKEGNSYEVIITINKNELEPQPLLRKMKRLYAKSINTIVNSPEKLKEIKEKIKKPFLRNERILPDSGAKIEVFKKEKETFVDQHESLAQMVKDFTEGKNVDEKIKKESKKVIEEMKNEKYTEENMEEKIKKKREEDKKKGEKLLEENLKKTEEMTAALEKKSKDKEQKENEEEYEYN